MRFSLESLRLLKTPDFASGILRSIQLSYGRANGDSVPLISKSSAILLEASKPPATEGLVKL
jgi:hypothetical protein